MPPCSTIFKIIRSSIPATTEILAVVKADAYGHGFMDISRELEELGVNAFGVAFLAEGIQLRKSGIDKPILLLGGIYPGQENKCIGFNLSTAVFTLEQAQALNHAAGKLFRKAQIHLKVDTGMGRLGIPYADAPAFLDELKRLPNMALEGIISHFASADELDESGHALHHAPGRAFRPGAGRDTRGRVSLPAISISPTAPARCSAELSRLQPGQAGHRPLRRHSLPPISRVNWTCSRSCA